MIRSRSSLTVLARPAVARLLVAGMLATGLLATAGCSSSERGEERADPVRPWDGIAYPVWSADAYAGDEVATGLADIAATGAGTVTITPTWYVTDTSSSVPGRDPAQTATDDSVRAAIAEAHRLGLRVLLKPHVDLEDDGDRAEIVPSDPGTWFIAYTAMIAGYAALAQETGVELLSIGTELAGTMAFPSEWEGVITAVRTEYRGKITYAANFDSYRDVLFWDRVDFVGIDAYFELVDEPTTAVDTLVAAWQPVLDAIGEFAAGDGYSVLFTEAGYVSQVGSTTQPWNWEISDESSDAEQAAGYEALFRAVAGREWFAGVQWWMWDDLADTGEDQALDYTPRDKPAEEALRAEWNGSR